MLLVTQTFRNKKCIMRFRFRMQQKSRYLVEMKLTTVTYADTDV